MSVSHGKNKDTIDLAMEVGKESAVGVDLDHLGETFDKVQLVEEDGRRGKKVKFRVQTI